MPGVAGDGGRAESTPERIQSPTGEVEVSFTKTAQAVVGGTALEEKFRVRGVAALDVVVSNGAPLPPTNLGLMIEPVSIGRPAL